MVAYICSQLFKVRVHNKHFLKTISLIKSLKYSLGIMNPICAFLYLIRIGQLIFFFSTWKAYFTVSFVYIETKFQELFYNTKHCCILFLLKKYFKTN